MWRWDPLCPVDAVVGRLQELNKGAFNTFVFGLNSKLSDISPAALQAFANAGAGQPVVVGDIWSQCFYWLVTEPTGWKTDATAAGVKLRPIPIGAYARREGRPLSSGLKWNRTNQMRTAINGGRAASST